MRLITYTLLSILFLSIAGVSDLTAKNEAPPQRPIIQTKYTADPAPMVYNDTVFYIHRMTRTMRWVLKWKTGAILIYGYGKLDRTWGGCLVKGLRLGSL